VNWCPALGTVLANEEVKDGKSERGDPRRARPLRQWMLRITAYAERCSTTSTVSTGPRASRRCSASGSAAPRAPRSTLRGRRVTGDETFEVFTTRPDTLFGATYMVLAPEHPLVARSPRRAARRRRPPT
jgi:leucyl-tRNA synthetase